MALFRRGFWVAATGFASTGNAAREGLIRGVSYGPVPLKSTMGAAELPSDDWFSDEAVPMWGPAGRADLRVIRRLGANLVRLYGNNPMKDHTNFLDEALAQGLSVAAGMSDYPYYQQVPGSCWHTTDFNCFSQVKPLYLENLRRGFLTLDGSYHPALKYMNILNEPDLKMPCTADTGSLEGVFQMCRTILSAFDAMLDAEIEAGVKGALINFTATFSYAICSECQFFNGKPALAQMAQLDDAMRHPTKYNYTAKNDITAAYKTRFTNSFNTANPATDLAKQVLDHYPNAFPTTPVYIAEYHCVHTNQSEDLALILHLAEENSLFLGVSFFEYQVAYWKAGSELAFGLFGLGDYIRAPMLYSSKNYNIYCLTPETSAESGIALADAVSQAYEGPGVDKTTLCAANPLGVPLDHAGYSEIASQGSVPQMALFVEHAVHHRGGTVRQGWRRQFEAFAEQFATVRATRSAFVQMNAQLDDGPGWADFDPEARCIADRSAHPAVLGRAIGWACSFATTALNCSIIPAPCTTSPYKMGDYVFSRYFKEHGDGTNPVKSCYFQGAAIYASSNLYSGWTGAAFCIDPTKRSAAQQLRLATLLLVSLVALPVLAAVSG